MKEIAVKAQQLKDELLQAVDLDARAFSRVMEAFRLPRGAEEQVRERMIAVEDASKEATLVPLSVLEKSVELAELAFEAASRGNQNSVSDAGVAGIIARSCGLGAFYNVKINLRNIQDENFKKKTIAQAEKIRQKLEKQVQKLEKLMSRIMAT
jgi:formiminotetrahydrofolate cyclodeaminase